MANTKAIKLQNVRGFSSITSLSNAINNNFNTLLDELGKATYKTGLDSVMLANLDMGGLDIVNTGEIHTNTIFINGKEFSDLDGGVLTGFSKGETAPTDTTIMWYKPSDGVLYEHDPDVDMWVEVGSLLDTDFLKSGTTAQSNFVPVADSTIHTKSYPYDILVYHISYSNTATLTSVTVQVVQDPNGTPVVLGGATLPAGTRGTASGSPIQVLSDTEFGIKVSSITGDAPVDLTIQVLYRRVGVSA